MRIHIAMFKKNILLNNFISVFFNVFMSQDDYKQIKFLFSMLVNLYYKSEKKKDIAYQDRVLLMAFWSTGKCSFYLPS